MNSWLNTCLNEHVHCGNPPEYSVLEGTNFFNHHLINEEFANNCNGQPEEGCTWVFVFTGLDYWTGLLDWTTGLTFDLTFELFFLSMINIAVVLLAKVNLGVLGK